MRVSPPLQASLFPREERLGTCWKGGSRSPQGVHSPQGSHLPWTAGSLPPGRGRVGSGGRLGGGRLAMPTDLRNLQNPGDRHLAEIATLPVGTRTPPCGLRHPPRVYRHPGRQSSPPCPSLPPPRSAVVATLPMDIATQGGSPRHPTSEHCHPGWQSSPPCPRTLPARLAILATLPVSTATQVGSPRRQVAARSETAVCSGEVLLQRGAPLLASPLTQPAPSQGGGTLRLGVTVDPAVELPGDTR
jgi:hypothetical protein